MVTTHPTPASSQAAPPKLNWRVIVGSLSGSTVEWFDFLVYGTVAVLVFNHTFFVTDSEFLSTMFSMASFALTFFFRPIGGMIFAHIGDHIGRKKTLFITLMLMGGGTVLIGLTPDYNSIGIAAPLLLIFFRILQGIGIGGEWGGALLLAYEYAPKKHRGLYGAIPQMGISLGMLLSAGFVALLALMPTEAFMSWGWRIPFVSSVVLVGIGMFVRSKLEETPDFQKVKDSGAVVRLPIAVVMRDHWRAVLVSIGAKAAETGPFYIFGTYIIAYATGVLDARRDIVLNAVAAAALVATIWMPIFGEISDRVPRATLYRIVTVLTILYAFPYYIVLNSGTTTALFTTTIVGFGLLWGSVNAILGTMIAESFSPEIRYSGATLGYQLGAAVFGGTAPLIATALKEWSGGEWWPISVYVIACATLGFIASFFVTRVAHVEERAEA
ncbi:MFS transporter [Corynebacterium timonense]|uniref:Sugar transporter n=1 Tax=Corynebacterium timonense TaxID=441500 RepID=A0A1H1V5E8_9CORY|nr:MFS transporter [Corynebacterium timonense]SDS79958.1 Sugar transporter [Corynebacterium timonense]